MKFQIGDIISIKYKDDIDYALVLEAGIQTKYGISYKIFYMYDSVMATRSIEIIDYRYELAA